MTTADSDLLSVHANREGDTETDLNALGKAGLTLGIFAIMMPIGFQSILGAVLLIWFFSSSQWRKVRQLRAKTLSWRQFNPTFVFMVKVIAAAALIQLLLLAFNEAGTSAASDRLKLMGKQGVYGLLIMLIYSLARERGFLITKIAPWILGLMAMLTAYNFLQRYTGVDWVHGFHQKVNEQRFAYGVYRVSGFMSHPLTFAYNCVIFYVLNIALGLTAPEKSRERLMWFVCAGLSFINLVISSSRWAILIGLLVSAAFVGMTFRHKLKKMIPFAILAMLALLVAASLNPQLSGRFTEIFNGHQDIYERIPRLAFWKVHWQMFLDSPVMGLGLDNIKALTESYYSQLGFADLERKYNAHNIFLQTLADSGLIGLTGMCIILVGSYKAAGWLSESQTITSSHAPERLSLAWKILIIAVALLGLMQNNLRDSEHAMALWISMAVIFARSPSRMEDQRQASET